MTVTLLWAILTLLAIWIFIRLMIPTAQGCGKIKLDNAWQYVKDRLFFSTTYTVLSNTRKSFDPLLRYQISGKLYWLVVFGGFFLKRKRKSNVQIWILYISFIAYNKKYQRKDNFKILVALVVVLPIMLTSGQFCLLWMEKGHITSLPSSKITMQTW